MAFSTLRRWLRGIQASVRGQRAKARTRRAPLLVEGLEDRLVPANVTLLDGVLRLEFTATETTSENVTLYNDGSRITLLGDVGSPFEPAVASVHRNEVTDSGGSSNQSLTFAGDHAFTLIDGLTTTGVDSVAVRTTTSTRGSSDLTITATKTISVQADLFTEDGDLTLSANWGETPGSGDFVGIDIDASDSNDITIGGGSGDITIQGRGGDSSRGLQSGVLIHTFVAPFGITDGSIHFFTSGTVTIAGQGGLGGRYGNNGVEFVGGAFFTSSHTVSITGTGGGAADSVGSGVHLAGGLVTDGGGGISVVGTAGGSGYGGDGVYVRGLGNFGVITSWDGDIQITGTAAGYHTGVFLHQETLITAYTPGDSITINGTSTKPGPYGFAGTGVQIQPSCLISTYDAGEITITGTGDERGVWMLSSQIKNHKYLNPPDNITIVGNALGVGIANSEGVKLDNSSILTDGVLSVTGSGLGTGVSVGSGSRIEGRTTTVTGTNTGSGSGVSVPGGGRIRAFGSGDVTVTAIGNSNRAALSVGGDITNWGTGNVVVVADSLDLTDDSGGINAANATVSIRPYTAGTAIDLGGADVLGDSQRTLGLSAVEWRHIDAARLVVGDDLSGTMTISRNMVSPRANDIELVTASDILFSGGHLLNPSGTLRLDGGSSPAAVVPSSAATDATGSVTLASDVRIKIDGIDADVSHDQLKVNGALNLDGSALVLTGSYVPVFGEAFPIVTAPSVTGRFTGLNDGDVVVFNGVPLTIHYFDGLVTLIADKQMPTDITLDNSGVAENQAAGTLVGSFSTSDPDAGDGHSYALASGEGDADNARFTIDATGNLRTATRFDFEVKSSYSIRVRSTDGDGLSVEKVFTIRVTDDTVLAVSAPAEQTVPVRVPTAIAGVAVEDQSGSVVTVTLRVKRGILKLRKISGVTITGNGSSTVKLSGDLAAVNQALASLLYTGTSRGEDALTIKVSHGSQQATGRVAIRVTPR